MFRLTCNCLWCRACLNTNVRLSLNGQDRFPPKCCGDSDRGIDLVHAQVCLDDTVAARLASRWDELHDPDPTYCANPRCGQFVPADDEDKRGRGTTQTRFRYCSGCGEWVCTRCKRRSMHHPVHQEEEEEGRVVFGRCPESVDEATRELLRQNDWRVCPKCYKVIERTDGCNTVKCNCGELFCYNCGIQIRPMNNYHAACGCESEYCTICGRRKEDESESCWLTTTPSADAGEEAAN